eukprot:m.102517 g.102517  ORF g.102517 m.102517 type:complete len:193 (+) comp12595_c0_seq1:53-631(+)
MTLEWKVTLTDGQHAIRFIHGTTSGKRVLLVDGKEVIRKNWMFKLVGDEHFVLGSKGDHRGCIQIVAEGLSYTYSLYIDGKPYEDFTQTWKKAMKTWYFEADDKHHLIVMDMETMKIFVDGEETKAEGDFVDDGTETHFNIGSQPAYIFTTPSTEGNTMDHILFVNDEEVLPTDEDRTKKPQSQVKWTGKKS